jgi:putative SOS response-associated peptidase YedK
MIIIWQVSESDVLEAHFEISFEKEQAFEKQYRINHQIEAIVITCQNPHTFSTLTYGMVPFWSKDKILHYEAPIDGGQNTGNEPGNIKKRIILHPSFRRPIRETRCLIPVDYFIIQSTLFFEELWFFKS